MQLRPALLDVLGSCGLHRERVSFDSREAGQGPCACVTREGGRGVVVGFKGELHIDQRYSRAGGVEVEITGATYSALGDPAGGV